MELKQLRLVYKVVEAGSFSKAALELNISHSRISRQISALEKECGKCIFSRNGRGVELTEYGNRIISDIKLILETTSQISDFGNVRKHEAQKKVRVGALPAITRKIAGPLLCKLRKSFPQTLLELSESTSGELQKNILDGNLEIAIFLREGTQVEIKDHILEEWGCYLIGLPQFSILRNGIMQISELADIPLILHPPPNIDRKLIDAQASKHGVKLNIVAEAFGADTVAGMVLSGEGCLIGWMNPQISPKETRISMEIEKGNLLFAQIPLPELSRALVLSISPTPNANTKIVADQIVGYLENPPGTHAVRCNKHIKFA